MPLLLIPGLVFFSALVLVALANTANVHTKAANEANVGFLAFLREVVNPKTYVHAATQLTRAAVSRWALAQLKPITAWFVALNALVLSVFRTQTAVTEGTASALERMRGHTIPQAAGKAAAPAKAQAKAASRTAHTALGKANATTTTLGRQHAAQHRLNVHYSHGLDVALPRTIGGLRTREEGLSRDVESLRNRAKGIEHGAIKTFEWLRAHPFSAAFGVFSAVTALALNRLGYGFLRCRSWKRVGKGLTCGMGSLLADLLAIGFAYTVVVDPVAIAKAAVAAEDTMDSIIRRIAD